MKKIVTLGLFAALLLCAGVSCTDTPTPLPDGGGTTLDPEVVPKQDEDPYPNESADLEFSVSSLFGTYMVIQQNKELKIWGLGKTGDEVKVSVSWSSKTFTNKVNGRGQWRIRVNVPPAPEKSKSQVIMVECGDIKKKFSRILIGEVWVCSGQSNMQMIVAGSEGYQEELTQAGNYPDLRVYTSDLLSANSPKWDAQGTGWLECDASTVGGFSAVAYYFGKKLIDELNVPVGLIVNAYGGATAQAFTPARALEADPKLKAWYMDPYWANPGNYNGMTIPGGIWNAMVNPFLNYSIRGMIWYQGEGNWSEYDLYPKLINTMVTEWRKGFGQGDFPHYYVQIAGYFFEKSHELRVQYWDIYSFIREAQAKIRTQVANSEMVTTMDIGNPDDIHPAKKREVGERLANIALNRDYGKKDVNYLGPRYKSHVIDGGKVTVTFDYADGLRTNNGAAPKLFYIAGEDKKFYLADAVIDGNRVVLTNASVPSPVAIRYAFVSAPVTNLENAYGIPAEPFRTDEWALGSTTYNPDDMHTQPPY